MNILKLINEKIIRPLETKQRAKLINHLEGSSILDIGCRDDSLSKEISKKFEYTGIDSNPENKDIIKTRIEYFKTKKKFDIVCAFSLLEHTEDPVKVMKIIKRLAKKFVIISVPNEPYYTITRFFIPEKEHYWTIHPSILKNYFGEPILEKFYHFRRGYLALYKIN